MVWGLAVYFEIWRCNATASVAMKLAASQRLYLAARQQVLRQHSQPAIGGRICEIR